METAASRPCEFSDSVGMARTFQSDQTNKVPEGKVKFGGEDVKILLQRWITLISF